MNIPAAVKEVATPVSVFGSLIYNLNIAIWYSIQK